MPEISADEPYDLRVAVWGYNSGGSPDAFLCRVRCTLAQYDGGDHYDAAKEAADEAGYDGELLAVDERDDGMSRLDESEWDDETPVIDIRPAVDTPPAVPKHDPYLRCRECGSRMRITADRVSHHVTNAGEDDHDADGDHAAVLDESGGV